MSQFSDDDFMPGWEDVWYIKYRKPPTPPSAESIALVGEVGNAYYDHWQTYMQCSFPTKERAEEELARLHKHEAKVGTAGEREYKLEPGKVRRLKVPYNPFDEPTKKKKRK